MSSADEPVAWVLNLDAEDELARPGAHTPSQAMQARLAGLVPRLRAPGGLVQPGDEVAWPADQPLTAGRWGRAWCPTRWALERLARAGLRVPPAPSQATLRLVNHRRFSHALGQALPAAGYAENAAQLAELMSDREALGAASAEGAWLLKRPLGYAGRGRKRILLSGPTATEQAWIDASLRTGDGLQVEPWVSRLLDCALHGWLDAEGRCTWGTPTVQDVDATGAWQGTRTAAPGELTPEEDALLHREAARTAKALQAAGYFGPFGLDAFRWRDARGEVRFQPRCEVNARYSMGWSVGMGDFRPPPGLP